MVRAFILYCKTYPLLMKFYHIHHHLHDKTVWYDFSFLKGKYKLMVWLFVDKAVFLIQILDIEASLAIISEDAYKSIYSSTDQLKTTNISYSYLHKRNIGFTRIHKCPSWSWMWALTLSSYQYTNSKQTCCQNAKCWCPKSTFITWNTFISTNSRRHKVILSTAFLF